LPRRVIKAFAVRDAQSGNVRGPRVTPGRHLDVFPFARARHFVIVRAPFSAADGKVHLFAHIRVANPEPHLARGRIAGQALRIVVLKVLVRLRFVGLIRAAGRAGCDIAVGRQIENFVLADEIPLRNLLESLHYTTLCCDGARNLCEVRRRARV
jgi:hypothetical protein